MKQRKVLILYTGGTFGMDVPRSGKKSLTVSKLTPASLKKRLLAQVPEIQGLAHCDVEVLFNRDSAHMGPDQWIVIAEAVKKNWAAYDGFVILHGTDTLSYTASALSFLLRPCKKPVVLTGAQRPLAALRNDARTNLVSAVEIASLGEALAHQNDLNQVLVYFDDQLFQGNRTRKRSAFEFGAFESPLAPSLARVGAGVEFLVRPSRRKTSRVSSQLHPAFSSKVALVQVTPGFPSSLVSDHLLEHLDALVLVVFSSGTAPTHEAGFEKLLKQARVLEVPVVLVTGGVHPATYAAGRQLLEYGCFWAGSMTPECAYVKAAWILAQAKKSSLRYRVFKRWWFRDFCGEGVY